jgi:glycosyltransferase involved in cell wall biosynthesis
VIGAANFSRDLKALGAPDFQPYFDFVELSFRAFWQKSSFLEKKRRFVDPAIFAPFWTRDERTRRATSRCSSARSVERCGRRADLAEPRAAFAAARTSRRPRARAARPATSPARAAGRARGGPGRATAAAAARRGAARSRARRARSRPRSPRCRRRGSSASVPALARYLVRERPDALLSALSYSNLAALWARERAGVPVRVVISEHNTLSVRSAHAQSRRWRVLPVVESRWYPRADAILAVSQGVADDLARTTGIPRERIAVTYNPVLTGSLAAAAREPVEHAWLAPGAPPVVLGVGKLKPQKGYDVLLRAFAQLRATRPRGS